MYHVCKCFSIAGESQDPHDIDSRVRGRHKHHPLSATGEGDGSCCELLEVGEEGQGGCVCNRDHNDKSGDAFEPVCVSVRMGECVGVRKCKDE